MSRVLFVATILSVFYFIGHCKIPDKSLLNPPIASNGVIKLIIKSYVNEILKANHLNEELVKKKLLMMSDHISSHPALHQKYLWVGSQPPMNFDPDKKINSDERNEKTNSRGKSQVIKRFNGDSNQFPSEEICKTNRQWEQINKTHDFYDNQVEIVQEEDLQQFVFSYRCASVGPCTGISPLYESECAERNGWMYMFYKQPNKPPQWGYVSAPHHCACKIQPKFAAEKTVEVPPTEEK